MHTPAARHQLEMEDAPMLLIRNGYALSMCRVFLSAFLVVACALALGGYARAMADDVNQIRLTEKHIAGFIAADDEMAKIYGPNVDNSDPKVQAQGEKAARKHGFASFAEYNDVSLNIAIIMSGIDEQTKEFTDPTERLRQEIAALEADTSVSDDAKKEELAQLDAALKEAKPIQFKENIALVLKNYDKLLPLMQVLGPAD